MKKQRNLLPEEGTVVFSMSKKKLKTERCTNEYDAEAGINEMKLWQMWKDLMCHWDSEVCFPVSATTTKETCKTVK